MLRNAEPQDMVCVVKLFSTLNTEQYSFTDERKILESIEAGRIFVTEGSDEITGAVEMANTEGGAEIVAISVVSSVRGAGNGKMLISAAEKWAISQSLPKLWCWSLARFEAAAFYRATGFHEAYFMRQQFFGEDCWFFGKLLQRDDQRSRIVS